MKKEHTDWYLALIHLSVVAAMVILFFLIYGFLTGFFGTTPSGAVGWIIEQIIFFVSLFLGIKYSAKFLQKKYVIPNVATLALYSSLYLGVLGGISWLLELMDTTFNFGMFALDILMIAASAAFLYFFTKKYVSAS